MEITGHIYKTFKYSNCYLKPMLRSKKAASEGTAIATIIIIIALFMTLYILFIPPAEREQLLQQNTTTTPSSGGTTSSGRLELLAESPGMVTPTTEFATVHRIPSINLFLRDEPKITTLAQNLQVSKGVFSESSPQIRFQTEDLTETNAVTIFFAVEKADGELRIKVNGNTIYTEEIEQPGVKSIEIAKSYLKDDNKLEFKVSSPGIAFWSTNKYSLKDVRIKQEFERRNNEETRTFTLPQQEKDNMINAKVTYTQQCNVPFTSGQTARLDILLNDRRAHTSEIRCITTQDEMELDPELFVEGSNTITFRLEKGDFSFNLLKLQTESRESERPTYFFALTTNQYNDIQSGERALNLQLLLDSTRESKNARILVNNNEIMMQTDRNSFDQNLKDYVQEGTNFIKIVPENSFTIIGLKVTLE